MREWLRDQKIIRGSFLLPTLEAAQDLADAASGLQMTVEAVRGSWKASEARRKRRSEAMQTLLDEIPAWHNELQATLDIYSKRSLPEFLKQDASQAMAKVHLLERALQAVQDSKRLHLSLQMFIPHPEKWHDFAKDLGYAFSEAVRSTNPTLTLHFSNDGPIVRFLVAAIPHITGETPTTAAVARYLQRMDR